MSDINLSINKGESYVIIGPNGSGKTTLLRIIALLEKATSGKIHYKQQNILTLTEKQKIDIRRNFAYVRQKPVVLNKSVFDNIAYPLKIRDIDEELIEKRVKKVLKDIEMEQFADNNARSLSGGEMQRVAIAMNFMIDPEIYFLDEVSANLDPKNVLLIEKYIKEIKDDKEKTLIMTSHDPMEAIKLADHIAVINDGKIIQIDTPEKIFTEPKDEFTAHFMGYENIFSGFAKIDKESGITIIDINKLTIFASSHKEGKIKACVRPESIVISKEKPIKTSIRNILEGIIERVIKIGNIVHVYVISYSEQFLVSITKNAFDFLSLQKEESIFISFKATDIQCL